MHLLVLDDERGMTAMISMVARDRGWTADVAVNEDEFRSHFQTRRPDVLMLDLQLGKSDGVEQLRFLAQEKFTGSIVLMSGFDARVLSSSNEIGQGLGLAMAPPLAKPIRIAALRDMLDRLERSQASPLNVLNKRMPLPDGPAAEKISTEMIRQAFAAGEMALHLQPILSVAGRRVGQLEALLRWNHPLLGPVPPDRFIPIAESDEGTLKILTNWVIKTAADYSGQLTLEGYETIIAVNLSAVSLRAGDFPDQVEALLTEAGAPLDGISFEVTETAAMENPSAMAAILTRLRLKGFDLALDDFGTGHSSLKVLRQMPFSAIKIDRSFVLDMTRSADSLAIVQSVVGLARTLGVESIAEGVETKEAADELIRMGVTRLQGNYLSPALPLHEMAAWLKGWTRKPSAGTPPTVG